MNWFFFLWLLIILTNVYGNESYVLSGSAAYESAIKGTCNGDPVAYIIRQHPELLIHKRDAVLRLGAKAENQYSLQGCINCHAVQKKDKSGYHQINASGQFCTACHEKTAISVDCFECHRTTPYSGKKYYQRK